jgi:hypothetical protein
MLWFELHFGLAAKFLAAQVPVGVPKEAKSMEAIVSPAVYEREVTIGRQKGRIAYHVRGG